MGKGASQYSFLTLFYTDELKKAEHNKFYI